jgi:hypothetical protein
VTAPPGRVLDLLEAGVRDRGGAVLVGPAGVGKTSLARTVSEHVGGSSNWVIGTASARAVPFAAFGGLIDVPDTGNAAAVLRTAREALGDGRLLVVDDAHLLDRLSATLVYQLAIAGAARLIVVVDSNEAVPEAISALWRDGVLPRIDFEVHTRFAGHVDDVVSSLPPAPRAVLEYLAVQDPLPVGVVSALAGDDAVGQALELGVVDIRDDVVRPVHPRYADAVHDQLGAVNLRRLRTALVGRLLADPPRDVVGRLQLAVSAAESDSPQPVADVVAAAQDALRLGDLELGERLGRAAVEQDRKSLASRLPLAYALAWQGRGREADTVLAAVNPIELTETELVAWALPRAANQFWMLSEPERATAFLQATRNRVASPAARTTLDALAATFAMNAGSPRRAMEIATEVLSSPSADDTAVGWAAAAAALSCARMGRFSEVDALADRALAAGHPGLLRFTSGFGQTTTLLMAGELDRAHVLGQQLIDFAERQQPGRAIGEILVADVLIARGELDAAVALLRGAATALAPTGYSWGPLAWMLLAQGLGQQAAMVEAGKALSRAESRHGLKSMLFAPELALARAWTLSARRDSHAAIAAAREAARAAERGGQSAVALRALHDAVRLGDARAVDGIDRLGVDCVFGRLALDHARALAAGDPAALTAVATRFAAIGMNGPASDASAQAENLATGGRSARR